MRDRGMCKARVDAIAAAPREHDARRVSGRCLCGIRQRPPLLGDGDRWQWWRRRRPRLFHRRQQRALSTRRVIGCNAAGTAAIAELCLLAAVIWLYGGMFVW